MSKTSCALVLGAIALAVTAGCGGASAPTQYHYGDMFTDDEAEHRGGRGGGSYSLAHPPPPPQPSSVASGSTGAPMEPPADMAAPPPARARFAARPGRNFRQEMEREESADYSSEGAPGAAEEYEADEDSGGGDDDLYAAASPTTEPPGGGEAAAATTPRPQGEAPQRAVDTPTEGPLLIYEAELDLAVHEVREKIDAVAGLASEIGGFVLSQDDTSVVIRVPAGRFDESLERIAALGDVLRRRVTADDVSDQVRDLRIRLRNAIQMRDRLLVLLAQAQTVPESLVIEHELQRLNETIALIQGTLEDYQERIAFSTITVRFQAIRVEGEVPRERFRLPFAWLDQVGLQRLMSLPYDLRRR